MLNWRAHVLEPVLTAVIVFGITMIVVVGAVAISGRVQDLPIALLVGTFYPLILAFPWVAFTATFSWLLRRRSHWWSLVMGGLASVFLSCIALWPVIINTVTSASGINGRDAPAITFVAVAIVVVSVVQFFVHIVSRAQHRAEAGSELG